MNQTPSLPKVYESRRGAFVLEGSLAIEDITEKPELSDKRWKDVQDEIQYALEGKLKYHKYWQDEPISFILQYQSLYQELFTFKWLKYKDARHNVVSNRFTCVSLIQYFDGQLIVYSRSTDMANGYIGDKAMIHLLARSMKQRGWEVNQILWIKAIPHRYVEKGIARLKEKYDE